MSFSEFLVVAVVAFLLFGGKRLPEVLRSVGGFVARARQQWQVLKRESGLDVLDELKTTYRDLSKEKPPDKETGG